MGTVCPGDEPAARLQQDGTPGALTRHADIDTAITFTVANGRISGLFLSLDPAKVDRFVRSLG